MIRYFTLLTILCLVSCTQQPDRFYKTSHIEDIDVLPLIKPYKLWSPVPGVQVWHLDFSRKVAVKAGWEISQMQVCRINVANHIIYGHCADNMKSANAAYFVIVPDKKIEQIFLSKDDWEKYLSDNGLHSENQLDVLEVYNAFKNDYRSLPWLGQVEGG